MAEVRAVVIKTGVVSRLVKELAWYEAETADEAAKTERLRAAGACPHDVKQQECVASESAQMVPDCRLRLQNAVTDLEAAVAECEASGSAATAELAAARAALGGATPLFA